MLKTVPLTGRNVDEPFFPLQGWGVIYARGEQQQQDLEMCAYE